MASCSLKNLCEKRVLCEISKCVWSPKMDLLVLAFAQGHVSLHRLSWQKVWNLAPPLENIRVTDMAWRPDGKVLAIGYTSGKVLLIDIEDGSTIHELSFNGEVSALSWSGFDHFEDLPASEDKVEDQWNDFMYPLPSLSKTYAPNQEHEWQEPRLLKNQTSLTILSVGIVPSGLNLYAFGLFHVASLDLNESGCNSAKILNIMPSHDLTIFSVVVERQGKNSSKEVAQIPIQTNLLSQHHKELCSLAQKYGQIHALMLYKRQTISQIEEAWETSLLEMDSKLASYAATVPEGGVSADFLDLLVFGYASSEFELFLTNKLTEKGLKKLRQTVELSYSNMQMLVAKNLKAVGLSLVYLLSQVVGMARQVERYSILGVDEDTVLEAMREAGSFLLKSSEMLQVIDSSMQDYQCFLKWISGVQLRFLHEQISSELSKISQQEIMNIIDFLNESFEETIIGADGEKTTRFRLERVGQYLVNEDLKILPKADKSPWSEFLKSHPQISSHPLIFKHNPTKSLIQEHHTLTSILTKMGSQPGLLIAKAIVVGPAISLMSLLPSVEPQISQIASHVDQFMYISIISETTTDLIYLFQSSLATKNLSEETKNLSHMVTGAPFIFSPLVKGSFCETPHRTARMRIIDAQFFRDDVLSVLLQEDKDSNVATFAQLRISYFSKEFRCLSLPSGFPLSEANIPPRDASTLLESSSYKRLEPAAVTGLAVSGPRSLVAIVGEGRRKIRIYDANADEEEDEEDLPNDSTLNSLGVYDEHVDDGL